MNEKHSFSVTSACEMEHYVILIKKAQKKETNLQPGVFNQQPTVNLQPKRNFGALEFYKYY